MTSLNSSWWRALALATTRTKLGPSIGPRTFSSQTVTSKEKWSPETYLNFAKQRGRPIEDLISQISTLSIHANDRIVDLGCGPGNSTALLADRFPQASIVAVDSSEAMLARGRDDFDGRKPPDGSTPPAVSFEHGDLNTWMPENAIANPVKLFFSNAAFHWLRRSNRIPIMMRLWDTQAPGGVFAFQVPDNYNEPSHALMREVARETGKPWSRYFVESGVGFVPPVDPSAHGADLYGDRGISNLPRLPQAAYEAVRDSLEQRPDLDPIETAEEFYAAFAPKAANVDIWTTIYCHALPDIDSIVGWVQSTGLRPYTDRIVDQEGRQEFLKRYHDRLQQEYPQLPDGTVLLRYPRKFLVAIRR